MLDLFAYLYIEILCQMMTMSILLWTVYYVVLKFFWVQGYSSEIVNKVLFIGKWQGYNNERIFYLIFWKEFVNVKYSN